jgi:hypothetical protein
LQKIEFLLEKEKKLFVKAVCCEECNTTVYSRTMEDMRECECGRVVVYGGFKNFKYEIRDDKAKFKKLNVDLNATPDDLYRDYEKMEDKFGLIKRKQKNTEKKTTFIF